MAPTPRPLVERFWSKVDKRGPVPPHRPELGPCWQWTAGVDITGYGRVRRGGRDTTNEKAHRIAWELEVGPVPRGLFVLHKCDNPTCVRPAHLFLGSKGDNAQDAIRKGRWLKGDRHPNSRLHDADVATVRRLCAAGIAQRTIAARFGVSQHLVSLINRRKHRSA